MRVTERRVGYASAAALQTILTWPGAGWTASPGAGRYWIFQSAKSATGGYTVAGNATDTGITLSGLSPGTYYFTVSAAIYGVVGARTSPVSVVVTGATP
jgi:hypothetical protein